MCDGDFQGEPAKMDAVGAAHGDFGKYSAKSGTAWPIGWYRSSLFEGAAA
jgi:hypothetical protein